MALRAVLFDAGGTLIHPDYRRVGAVLERELGRAPDWPAFRAAEYAGRAAVESMMASANGSKDGDRWIVHFAALLEDLGFTAEEVKRVGPQLVAEHRRTNLWTVPETGAREALAALSEAGYVVGVVSNADGTVDRLLAGAGLAEHLAFVIDSGAVGVEKPDPAIFRLALDRAAVAPEEALYVGDVYAVDVVGARRAGLEAVLLDPLGRYADRDCRTARDVTTLSRELVAARRAA